MSRQEPTEWRGKRLLAFPIGPRDEGLCLADTDESTWLRSSVAYEVRE